MARTRPAALALVVVAGVALAQDDRDHARLEDGKPVPVALSKTTASRAFTFEVAERGPYALTVARVTSDEAEFRVRVLRDKERGDAYSYRGHANVDRFRFYPVLEKGTYRLEVSDGHEAVNLSLALARHECRLADADRQAALAAIERATKLLESAPPEKTKGDNPVAVEGLVLAALADGATPERRALLEKSWLPWLEQRGEKRGSWDGRKVTTAGHTLYEVAIAALGLAEATANGSEKARALLPRYVELLLDAQVGPRRPKEWNPVAAGDKNAGGWRYEPNARDADISVSGWCVIALTAASVAGVEVDGLREGLRAGVAYVLSARSKQGFTYQVGSGATGDIRNAIGALVALLLEGEESDALDRVLEALDRHLSAYTQTDEGEDYPLYYAYYATRVHFLRGGFPWQAWRTTMIRQLLENQTASGSWRLFGREKDLGERYATALGVLILRMCIEQVPAYLKDEVRGF